ncbi:MAG: hypothetical protein ABSB35_32295 [Bryobacteraceae bacterium]
MKCTAEEMTLLELDYGDLLRPEFRILPSRGWGQCTNLTKECLMVFGPKHKNDCSIFDTSPYVLPPGLTTPDRWDCDGFFLPADRHLRWWRASRHGPLALKFWNFRRFSVWDAGEAIYRCSWPNGVFEPSQINWAIPNFAYRDILIRIRH